MTLSQNKMLDLQKNLMKKQSFGDSIRNAIKGLCYLLKSERNFQIHTFAFILNVFLILFFGLKNQEIIIIMLVSALVLMVEIINTAIEKLCDFIHPNYHKSIGLIKDISAGAVLLTSVFAIIVGILAYFPYIKEYW